MTLPEAMKQARGLEERRIVWYAWMLRRKRISAEFVLRALSDPVWPGDSRG